MPLLALGALPGCASDPAAAALVSPVTAEILPSPRPDPAAPPPPPAPPWPDPAAVLAAPEVAIPEDFGRMRVYLDAGHGERKNPGNMSILCQAEQDFTLEAAQWLAEDLNATGHFEVRLSRQRGQQVPYSQRIEQAAAWGADVFLSVHSDVRVGPNAMWRPSAAERCPQPLEGHAGFTVLWSDEPVPAGPADLVEERKELARSVARQLERAGFAPYDGRAYGAYGADDAQRGVFVDRHEPTKRIRVLRRPTMPSVIIETHHAWDPEEVKRWREDRTRAAFSAAVASALIDASR